MISATIRVTWARTVAIATKNNKKPNPAPAPAVEETPVVAEEEEKIDLSEWLKDDIED